jgi:hypothetical protein
VDALVSHHYQDHPRQESSSSNASMITDHVVYEPPSQPSLGSQPHFPPQRQSSQRRPGPTSSPQISTTSDEQTAHPSRMQPQFPLPQAQPQQTAPSNESVPGGPASSTALAFTRRLTHREQELLAHLDGLKSFLATASSRRNAGEQDEADPSILVGHPSSTHPALNRFLLSNQEYVSCVLWVTSPARISSGHSSSASRLSGSPSAAWRNLRRASSKVSPDRKGLWWKAAELEKVHWTRDSLNAMSEWAVQHCSRRRRRCG